jgi:hypothetical protein
VVSPLPSIVTLAQAKKAARITSFDEDDDLYLRLEVSHELVLEHINNRVSDATDWTETIADWDVDTAPKSVKGAVLAMFVYLTRYHGDDDAKSQPELPNGDLPPQVTMYLRRFRDPSVS